MFQRTILERLDEWSASSHRKPLVLRGARQVGKTTVISIFSKKFDQYIYLNLELSEDRKLFENEFSPEELITGIFFTKGMSRGSGKTLIFIDEIQNSPVAVSKLRYLYETDPGLFVIAAGSLLESLIDTHISFPVGRVEFLALRPVSFAEFIRAVEPQQTSSVLDSIPNPSYAHDLLLRLFRIYTLIGGMPEVIQKYSEDRDPGVAKPVFESLIISYLDDVEKYARNPGMIQILRHTIKNSFYSAGRRIVFQGFGKSQYRSREMGEAFRILEKAMLLQLIYPCTSAVLPFIPDVKKSPKVQILDTGMVNYFSGLQVELFGTPDLADFYQGRIAEHIVGQELLASDFSVSGRLNFWIREKPQSMAEVDFLVLHENLVIPVEVKSGSTGRLRSLHQFIDIAPHSFAIRISSGPMSIEKGKTIRGKAFFLLNLPFYLTGNIERCIKWFLGKVG